MPNLSFFKMQGTLIEVVDKWCREHLPTKVSELENDAGYLTEATIPAPNDGVLTIKRNDSSLGTFSANQSANESINIQVPTDASEISYGETTVDIMLSTLNSNLYRVHANSATTSSGGFVYLTDDFNVPSSSRVFGVSCVGNGNYSNIIALPPWQTPAGNWMTKIVKDDLTPLGNETFTLKWFQLD